MIVVDDLRECGAPWRGGVACHMGETDGDVVALHSFAQRLGIPKRWFQPSNHPLRAHYDLSPRWRAIAVSRGAAEIHWREWAALRRAAIKPEGA